MKKYLMIGFAAVAFAACSNHDFETLTQEQIIKAEYDAKFVAQFGQPASNHNWGFGSSSTRAFTRAMPSDPTFSEKTTIMEKEPSKPEISQTFYNTVEEAKNAGVIFADLSKLDWNDGKENSWTDGMNIEINSSTTGVKDNKKDLTIYITEDISFYQGLSANGNTIVITEGKKVKLGNLNQKVTIYLAPKAELDLTEVLNWEGNVSTDWEGNKQVAFTLSNANIIMSSGSKLTVADLKVEYGSIINNGGTVTAAKLKLDNSSTLWNEGTVDVTDILTFDNDDHIIYNAPNKTITTKDLSINKKATIWNEGLIDVDGVLSTVNDYIYIYNNKTIEANSIDLKNNYNLLYNDQNGTVNTTGNITLHNTEAEIVNEGTLDCDGDLDLSAGGKMYNVSGGNVDIDGASVITNTNSLWKNGGQYTSGTFQIQNARQVYNNCKLTVEGNFLIHEGEFVMEGGNPGSSLICDSFTWEHNPDMWLGSNTLVSVKNTMLCKGFNTGYGIRGIGDDFAVIQAGSITKELATETKCCVAYFGNIFVDTKSHFPQGYLDTSDSENPKQPYYDFDDKVEFSFNSTGMTGPKSHSASTTTINITGDGTCNPGYSRKGDDPDPVTYEGRIMAEDLTVADNSDWDFNDVVFDWTIKNKKAYIRLLAAGGTLPIRVGGHRSDDTSLPEGSIEIHGADALNGYMVNTGVNTGKTSAEFVLDDHEYADHNGNDILITVQKGGVWVEITAETGEPAGKFNAPINTKWCEEYANIKKVYTSFAAWVANETVNWAVNPTAKYVDYKDVNDNKKEAAAAAE